MTSQIPSGAESAAPQNTSEQPLPFAQMPESSLSRVLIVDDDGVTRLLLRRLLEDAGYIVAGMAVDGETGILLARETQPDLILMDSGMPGLNGIDATRTIMDERPVAIIMLTGHSEEEHVNQAIEAGACTYLVKPINGQRLIPAIRTALDIFNTERRLKHVA